MCVSTLVHVVCPVPLKEKVKPKSGICCPSSCWPGTLETTLNDEPAQVYASPDRLCLEFCVVILPPLRYTPFRGVFAWNSASCVWTLQIIATPAQYDAVLVTQNMHFFAQKIIIKTRFLKA